MASATTAAAATVVVVVVVDDDDVDISGTGCAGCTAERLRRGTVALLVAIATAAKTSRGCCVRTDMSLGTTVRSSTATASCRPAARRPSDAC
jgi:hypothetical protein